MEKWVSPYLSTISKKFCENEFLLDTNELLREIDSLNNSNTLQCENINLFTLNVEKLYPSIQSKLATLAIKDVLDNDTYTNNNTKEAIERFINLSFEETYITYKDNCFKPKIGIPTGGCNSRQIADIFLHWVLFLKITPNLDLNSEIRFWKRFIDDCLGIWRGSKRTFLNFVHELNKETIKFGIHFPVSEVQFGKSVNFLDVNLYLDEENKIQYHSYSKPTDAKRFLDPKSFHPPHVFKSVPFSQMLRTINRNSKEDSRNNELDVLINDLVDSGYNGDKLALIKSLALNHVKQNDEEDPNSNTIVFPIYYFEGVNDFKNVINSLSSDLHTLIGDTKILIATKRCRTIGNAVVRNKDLCSTPNALELDQKCNVGGCLQCPLVNPDNSITINDKFLPVPKNLNCKSQNIIYLWQCKLCCKENSYFGRTIQKSHKRTNAHRNCFSDEKWQKSALSMHAKDVHNENFNLSNFELTVVKQISPQVIRREEFRYIDKYRTNSLGLNRYNATQ